MPAGEPFTREIQSRDAPEELERRVVHTLTALLAPANYELAVQDAQRIEYHRHYLRPGLLASVAAAVALAGALTLGGTADLALAGLAPVVLVLLVLLAVARGKDVLRVTVEPCPGGSAALLSGHLNGRGRMALLGLDPMSALPLLEPRQPLRSVDAPTPK